ncbi:hypothetical protein ACFWCA_37015 [Streptomyces phaeochromogenes]|uniref:hypothetical protein n=1 Tax=Streptomyces phaeochromogenes TaxID=1923 RepID=UPI0036A0EEE2
MSPTPDGRPRKLPFVVLVLSAGTFLMGTTEFVIAGLLPEIADDLNVSVSQAGLLITAFAAGMIVGAQAMAAATLHLPRCSSRSSASLWGTWPPRSARPSRSCSRPAW